MNLDAMVARACERIPGLIRGALVFLQGLAEVMRCILCLKEGQWPPRLHDVEELEKQILEKAAHEGIEAARTVTR